MAPPQTPMRSIPHTGPDTRRASQLRSLAERLAAAGRALVVEAPGIDPIRAGTARAATRVVFRDARAVDALLAGNHLALAEAYLAGRVDVAGTLEDVIPITNHLGYGASSRLREALWWLRFRLDRRRLDERSIAHHYDRPPDFFLAWLDATRSYTHGFWTTPDDDALATQERKLQYAIDALGLAPGMEVLDVGCGWGAFLEYAGTRGIRVQGITLSREQHGFVAERIRAKDLPCRVEYADFLDYRPARRFDGAVFMGSLEHLPDQHAIGRFLRDHLHERAGVYCDFVTSREGRLTGAFLARYIFPGVSHYVDVPGLVRALLGAGFNIRDFGDDTVSCALTVRHWARALEQAHGELAARHGEPAVRAFLLYLWSSWHFLATNRTQAYHLVASRAPLALPHPRASASATATRHATPKTSPTRP